MIISLKDQKKNSTPKLLDTMNSFGNIAGYTKSVSFLYTNNEQIEKGYGKTIPFAIAPALHFKCHSAAV
jgi:hypothetical protein